MTSSKVDLISTGAKQDLGWKPVADPAEFRRRALAVHAENKP